MCILYVRKNCLLEKNESTIFFHLFMMLPLLNIISLSEGKKKFWWTFCLSLNKLIFSLFNFFSIKLNETASEVHHSNFSSSLVHLHDSLTMILNIGFVREFCLESKYSENCSFLAKTLGVSFQIR